MNDYDMEALYERLSRQRLDDVAKHDDPIDRLHLLIICLAERNQILAMRIIRLEK